MGKKAIKKTVKRAIKRTARGTTKPVTTRVAAAEAKIAVKDAAPVGAKGNAVRKALVAAVESIEGAVVKEVEEAAVKELKLAVAREVLGAAAGGTAARRCPKSCACGCGAMTRGGWFVPGHDAKLLTRLTQRGREGDQEALAELDRWGWPRPAKRAEAKAGQI